METPYEILGIEKNATVEEIKIKYKQLVKKYHPDINDEINAQTQFIQIKKAYEELSKPSIEDFFGFGRIFGLEMWENLVKYEDFEIPSIDYVELRKAEKERDKLEKIYNIEGKELEKELEKEFKEIYGKYYASNRNERNFYKEISNLEPFINYFNACKRCEKIEYGRFREYNWTKNKVKLLCKLYMKFQSNYNREGLNTQKIMKHLKRILDNDISIKERIQKPTILNEPKKFNYDHIERRWTYKFEYDIQNQFHPKFLNKLPMKIQIFINNKIKDLLLNLEQNT